MRFFIKLQFKFTMIYKKYTKLFLMNHLGIDKLDSDIMDIYYKHENNINGSGVS